MMSSKRIKKMKCKYCNVEMIKRECDVYECPLCGYALPI